MPHVTHQNNPLAKGDFDPATGKVTLLPGSILLIDPTTQIIHANIAGAFHMFARHLAAGNTRGQPGNWTVVNPIPNLSPAAAHVFATGLQGNGWFLWLLNNGQPIDVLRQGNPPVGPVGGTQGQTPPPPGGANGQSADEEDEEDDEVTTKQQAELPAQAMPPIPPAWDGKLPSGMPNDCLSLYRFPPLPDYLRINRHRILALGTQVLPEWNAGYNAFADPVMQRLFYAFPTRRISRADVVSLFESWHDPVLCLVAAMIWGGIRIKYLRQLLAMGEPVLRSRMEALRPLIRAGAFEKAFDDCSANAPLKFEGVGPAFFTKLFYFIGQVPPVLNPAPLILDKWTSNAFLALGRQVCPSPTWEEWFDTRPLLDGDPATLKPRYINAEAYRLYVAWFNHWARLLGTSASQLEQFVFGWDRRGAGNVWWNPRNQLIDLARHLFCPPPGP